MPHLLEQNSVRKKNGSIAELGPALFIFFILIMFPLLDLSAIGVSYITAQILNWDLVRELSLVPEEASNRLDSSSHEERLQQMADARIEYWRNTGWGKFCGVDNAESAPPLPGTSLYNKNGINCTYGIRNLAVGSGRYLSVTTSLRVKPLISIPLMTNIPGLGASIPFSFSSEKLIEES